MNDIDKVGIVPDHSCAVPGSNVKQQAALKPQRISALLSELEQDSCLLAAEAVLKGQMAAAPHL
jgi:hypothetical protein